MATSSGHRGGGFTLLELMVTVALAATLAALALPSFDDVTLSSKLSASANDLVAGVAVARSEAIKRNAVASMCVSTNGSSCGSGGWEQGWIVVAGAAVIQKHPAAPNGLKVSSSVTKIDFQPSGVGSTQASITVCRALPRPGSQERVVNVGATGRAYVNKTATGSCS
ncbi:GspH/FimT family pseudopilin [Enterobacterales bacterium AE_CKDN230030158-1A_HGKHYDSX7]